METKRARIAKAVKTNGETPDLEVGDEFIITGYNHLRTAYSGYTVSDVHGTDYRWQYAGIPSEAILEIPSPVSAKDIL